MNESQGSKQQIVEKIKSSANILVTVSKDPSVDELSAALGLTSMLNGMNKHATAVVSGALPPAIDFLEPGKTFENTVDSLRDFIIALDKEKADHLRYKVDGDVVKIFITPYRTTIDESDLDFSQGDYNVELVLALGVKSKDNLDAALEAHGRILHDATVATISCNETSNLGSIDWTDNSASSISEMLVALSEALKSDKPLLSEQVATAFLTGIVASTDRFSNNKTSSKVMTMAAQLMAAGANQQLIATRLEEAHEIGTAPEEAPSTTNNDGSTNLNEGESTKVDRSAKKSAKKKEKPAKDDGTLAISHEKAGDIDEVAKQTADENRDEAAAAAEASVAAASSSDDELAKELSNVAPQAAAKPSVSDLQKDIAAASADVEAAADQPAQGEAVLPPVEKSSEPSMGGTLNATTEQAAADKLAEENSTKNKTILSHSSGSYVGNQDPVYDAPLNATMKKQAEEPKTVDIFAGGDQPYIATPISSPAVATPAPVADTPAPQTLADLDQQNRGKSDEHSAAQAAVADAYNSAPFDPSNQPQQNVGAQPLGDGLHTTDTPAAPAPSDGLPPLPSFTPPPPPPLPDMPVAAPTPSPQPQAGPVSSEQLGNIFGDAPAPQESTPAPVSNDPNQFKIPGQ